MNIVLACLQVSSCLIAAHWFLFFHNLQGYFLTRELMCTYGMCTTSNGAIERLYCHSVFTAQGGDIKPIHLLNKWLQHDKIFNIFQFNMVRKTAASAG